MSVVFSISLSTFWIQTSAEKDTCFHDLRESELILHLKIKTILRSKNQVIDVFKKSQTRECVNCFRFEDNTRNIGIL